MNGLLCTIFSVHTYILKDFILVVLTEQQSMIFSNMHACIYSSCYLKMLKNRSKISLSLSLLLLLIQCNSLASVNKIVSLTPFYALKMKKMILSKYYNNIKLINAATTLQSFFRLTTTRDSFIVCKHEKWSFCRREVITGFVI